MNLANAYMDLHTKSENFSKTKVNVKGTLTDI